MSTLNFSVFLSTYSDSNPSNAPSLSNFKWDREINGISAQNPQSSAFSLAPGETKVLFNGSRTLNQDGTTQYSIALKPLSSNTYQLSGVAGTLPDFRSSRTTGADATTQVTVTLNGPLVTFTSTGGTNFSLIVGGAVVGDYVRLGNLFNSGNQGEQQIIALTATSFTVNNELGAAEGPITLGASFASQVQIYSASGVQAGDTLVISGGFSLATQGSYKITSVSAEVLEFYSTDVLPQESNVLTQAVSVYLAAKKLVYLEANQHCSMIINSVGGCDILPFVIGNSVQPGVFMRTSTMYSMSVTNNSLETANLFLATVE